MSLAAYEQEPARLAQIQTSQDVAIARLGDWAKSASAAHSIAQTLVQTSFCPDSFRNKAGEATAAILAGLEVGLQPMAALRSFDIIQGQAAPRAITLRAIVQSHGHELEVVESTATRCRIRGRRRGSAEWQTVTWTIDRAKQAGLTNKPNWRKDSQAMLVARATGEMSRMIASDAILGIGYTVEEIADGTATAETTAPGPEAPTGTRRMGRKKPEPTPEPEQPEPTAESDPFDAADDDTADEPGETMLDPRSALAKRMFATIHDAGITEAQRLDFVSEVVGRDVGSSKELTEDEARQVIDACPAPRTLPEGGDDQ